MVDEGSATANYAIPDSMGSNQTGSTRGPRIKSSNSLRDAIVEGACRIMSLPRPLSLKESGEHSEARAMTASTLPSSPPFGHPGHWTKMLDSTRLPTNFLGALQALLAAHIALPAKQRDIAMPRLRRCLIPKGSSSSVPQRVPSAAGVTDQKLASAAN